MQAVVADEALTDGGDIQRGDVGLADICLKLHSPGRATGRIWRGGDSVAGIVVGERDARIARGLAQRPVRSGIRVEVVGKHWREGSKDGERCGGTGNGAENIRDDCGVIARVVGLNVGERVGSRRGAGGVRAVKPPLVFQRPRARGGRSEEIGRASCRERVSDTV